MGWDEIERKTWVSKRVGYGEGRGERGRKEMKREGGRGWNRVKQRMGDGVG